MAKRKSAKRPASKPQSAPNEGVMRIVGGRCRGRKIQYNGDIRTRPMKDRVREAIFNLLGPAIKGKYALDLFAGTGAIGLEAISRGSIGGQFIERHFPTARLIESNASHLQCDDVCTIAAADTFIWIDQHIDELPTTPWVVFSSPPYDFFVDRAPQMRQLLERLYDRSPSGSLFLNESDKRYDVNDELSFATWDVRTYPPATVAMSTKP